MSKLPPSGPALGPGKTDAAARPGASRRFRATPLSIDLLRAREAVMRRMRPMLQEYDVTEQQWRLLRALQGMGPLELKALARYACIQPASASRIVTGLEANGLVSRRTPPADRRRSVLALEPAGQVLLDNIAPRSQAVNREITATVGAEKVAALQDLLREFISLLWAEGLPD